MGVDNAWPFLASIEGLEFPEVEPKYAYAKVHLDMPATYLALFRSIQCHKAAADALYKNHLQWLVRDSTHSRHCGIHMERSTLRMTCTT